MRATSLCIAVLMVILVVLAGCTPRVPTTPTPVPPQAAPALPTMAVPIVSPEDAAWQKVVSEAKREGKVTLYTTGFVGEKGQIVSKSFENRYGIKLEFVTGIATVHIERIKTEHRAKKYIADTLDSSTSNVVMAKEEGLTVSMGDLPVLREKDIWTPVPPNADPEGHLMGYKGGVYPLWVNTARVKPGEEPCSYRELLDPRWRSGKITISSPVTTPTSIMIYLATKKAGTLDDDFWRRLGSQEVRMAPSFQEPLLWLAQGQVALSLTAVDFNMAPYVKEGAPVKALEMVEGVIVQPLLTSIALIKNGPHPNAARVFVNWILSQEGQQVFAEATGGMLPMRKDNTDIRPPALRVEMKKPLVADFSMAVEATKLQREGTLAKLLGMEK